MMWRRLLACACLALWPELAGAQAPAPQAAPVDAITRLVAAIDNATEAGDAAAIRALVTPAVPQSALSDFVQSLTFPRAARSAVKERDRAATADGKVRLLIETFTERSGEGRVCSWRVDLAPRDRADGTWAIVAIERLTVVSGLFRLALDTTIEYDVRNLVLAAPDLTLSIPSGSAFVARTPDGPTALVVLGRGRVEFAPKPEAERGQVHIFSGADALKTDFDAVFVRLNPAAYERTVAAGALKARPPDAGHTRRALQTFETYLPKSFQIDLNDLSVSRWSLVPSGDDFIAEIVTSRYGPLTYARASAEAEDISFFDRRRHRNISIYASDGQLEGRGRFYSEDDRREYDITRYEIETSFAPERSWVDGTAHLSLRAKAPYFSTLTLRLADSLVVRSVTSPQFGRLLHLRVVGQNNVLIGFPGTVVTDSAVELIITYGGRLPPQGVDREAAFVQQERTSEDTIVVPPELQYTYSNRSYWYPQAPTTDYATARLTITVPGDLDVVASGALQGPPKLLEAAPGQKPRKRVVFEAGKPTRYLAVLISRFQNATVTRLKLRDDDDPIVMTVVANPRQASKIRGFSEKAADILKFYTSLMGDAPYDAFTLALTESDVPGGHSPAYFAMVNQPLPTSPFVWNNDPVAFQSYASFFVAHEIAHQWWGQAIGWKNYHEQWISEGFAQYFAALYAERERGDQFGSVLRQMRKWAIELSPQGPVYLGYRLGHIRSEGRTFRALVYNKGAMVLHMLRRLVGDEAFFAGLRDFYATWRYSKAGTDDFRVAMERASGHPLGRFFDGWIYGSAIPTVRFSSSVTGNALTVRFEQKGDVFDIPITVTLTYADGTSSDIVVPVTQKTVERTIPLKGPLRSVETNRDNAALVEIEK
jgi:hypothetical protein